MAAATKENIPPQTDNKSSKKKRAKSDVLTSASLPNQASEESKEDDTNGETSSESTYLKEINKNIRNLKKKIAASSKVESIIAENGGKTTDELLASRVINADQKAQLEKKPGLMAQLEAYESQYEQYKKLDDEFQLKLDSERASLHAAHSHELERLEEVVRAEVKEEFETLFSSRLLTLSCFLRMAAAKRSDEDNQAEDNQAFEGALLLVYGGNSSAVRAMEKLMDGSDENVPGVDIPDSGFTFRHVREVSDSNSPLEQSNDALEADNSPLADHIAIEQTTTDPTIANAGLTELEDQTVVTNGDSTVIETTQIPEAATIGAEAANETAEAHWDSKASQSVTSGADGFEIIEHPRDPKETETGLNATPAAASNTQSWAEDVPTGAPILPQTAPADDGFHEVSHHRSGGRSRGGGHYEHRGRGGYRGRGGDNRGRGGYRGRGDGRGRGGPRSGGRGRGEATQ